MFPEFALNRAEPSEGVGVLGTMTTLVHAGETWIGDGWPGYLFSGTTFIRGRWGGRGVSWCFVPDRAADIDRIQRQQTWAALDVYWGQRAELVLDATRHWRRAPFEGQDAIEFSISTGRWTNLASEAEAFDSSIVKLGWDHEHCAICWRKIGNQGEPEGYVDDAKTWVCHQCFNNYVTPKSLGFIPSD
jgi:hypothetical protein